MAIEQVNIRVFTDQACTQVAGEFDAIGTSSPQAIAMTGLNSATDYWVKGYVETDGGLTGESAPYHFQTLASAVQVVGTVSLTDAYDTVRFTVSYTGAQGYTATGRGIEIATSQDFSNGQTYALTGLIYSEITGLPEHTTYFYRFYTDFDGLGRVWGQPQDNTFTTMYARPTFLIDIVDVGVSTAEITVSYSGLYPIDYQSLKGVVSSYLGDEFWLDLSTLTASTPVTATFSGLTSGTPYEVEVYMDYYSSTAESYETFTTDTTSATHFTFITQNRSTSCSVQSIQVRITRLPGETLTVVNSGCDVCAVPDFSGHQLGTESGGLSFRFAAENLNEHRLYYYRPWVQTEEYGREYGQTESFQTTYCVPDTGITLVSRTYDTLTVRVEYEGHYPIPEDGKVAIDIGGDLVELAASDLSQTFTFSGLDEDTEYYVMYYGSYYNDEYGIFAEAVLKTDVRMSLSFTYDWALNGTCTTKLKIYAPYDEHWTLDEFVINGTGLHQVGDCEMKSGDTYECQSAGYRWGGEYSAQAVIYANSDGYECRGQWPVVVPTQNLTIERTEGGTNAMVISVNAYGYIRTQYKIFNFDDQACSITLVNTVTGDEIPMSVYDTHRQNSSWDVLRSYGNPSVPAGTYDGKYTLANIMGQTETTTTSSYKVTVPGASIYSCTPHVSSVVFGVTYNQYYNNGQLKRTELWQGDTVVDTIYISQVGQNGATFTGLTPSTSYVIKTWFSEDEEPVTRTFTTSAATAPTVSNVTVTGVAPTSAGAAFTVTANAQIASTEVRLYTDASCDPQYLAGTYSGTTAAQQSVLMQGLTPNTSYWAVAYATDSGSQSGNSQSAAQFTTLAAGSATFSNVAGTWGTATKKLEFSADWSSTYRIDGAAGNFQLVMSATEDFAHSDTVNATYTRSSDGLSGTVSGDCLYYITQQPNAAYYVKVRLTDTYGEVLESQANLFHVPTSSQAGYMSFTPHQQGTYHYWLPTTVYDGQFTYAPQWKRIAYTDDNWTTVNRSGNQNWPNTVEIFYDFNPGNWTVELEVVDIYGNVFRTSQGTTITITKPLLYLWDTNRGSVEWTACLNRSLSYTAAVLEITNSNNQGRSERVDLMPVSQTVQTSELALPDGTYTGAITVVYNGTTERSDTVTVTLQKRGYIILTDTSTISGGELSWSASYTSGYDMVDGEITVYSYDSGDELGTSAVTIDGTDNGTMTADDTITVGTDRLYVSFEGTDDHSYTVSAGMDIQQQP